MLPWYWSPPSRPSTSWSSSASWCWSIAPVPICSTSISMPTTSWCLMNPSARGCCLIASAASLRRRIWWRADSGDPCRSGSGSSQPCWGTASLCPTPSACWRAAPWSIPCWPRRGSTGATARARPSSSYWPSPRPTTKRQWGSTTCSWR